MLPSSTPYTTASLAAELVGTTPVHVHRSRPGVLGAEFGLLPATVHAARWPLGAALMGTSFLAPDVNHSSLGVLVAELGLLLAIVNSIRSGIAELIEGIASCHPRETFSPWTQRPASTCSTPRHTSLGRGRRRRCGVIKWERFSRPGSMLAPRSSPTPRSPISYIVGHLPAR